jgi:pyruvate dehydrogenase E2 component (dihydrolipoamide acetyltransferase)
MLAFLIKACVAALRRFPEFNSSLDGDQLVLKRYYHIGFAADTPHGPDGAGHQGRRHQGRAADQRRRWADLAKKARDGKLSPGDMSGASFTISSLGGIGGRYFTPIINAPGGCDPGRVPVHDRNRSGTASVFEPRLMLPLSLSWDHRVIDGAAAARFNAYLGQILGDFRRVLL